jgi:hypothetical protein
VTDLDRKCIACGDNEEMAQLEKCPVCGRDFCTDCAYRALGRRFCNPQCARAFFYGDADDNEEPDE